MDNINSFQNNNIKFHAKEFENLQIVDSKQKHHANYAYLKQKAHEKHVDEFFLTDRFAPEKRHSNFALIGSTIGILTPLFLIAKKQNINFSKLKTVDKIKKMFSIKYQLPQILTLGVGGALGGLAGGLADKKEKGKLKKIEEASYQLMNIAFPAILVDKAIKLCENNKKLNNPYAKIAGSLLGIFAGATAAVEIANKTDDMFFDKYNKDPERKFKKKDLIVHVDDLLGTLVLTKLPIADKLHADKLLPIIYGWCGYHVGDS